VEPEERGAKIKEEDMGDKSGKPYCDQDYELVQIFKRKVKKSARNLGRS